MPVGQVSHKLKSTTFPEQFFVARCWSIYFFFLNQTKKRKIKNGIQLIIHSRSDKESEQTMENVDFIARTCDLLQKFTWLKYDQSECKITIFALSASCANAPHYIFTSNFNC